MRPGASNPGTSGPHRPLLGRSRLRLGRGFPLRLTSLGLGRPRLAGLGGLRRLPPLDLDGLRRPTLLGFGSSDLLCLPAGGLLGLRSGCPFPGRLGAGRRPRFGLGRP
ncbi:MAG TPA: hypothetical protein VFX88_20170, partial [Actinomycetota bacterium]|nr:hypothetical protein [Actinomycetota bacterium]